MAEQVSWVRHRDINLLTVGTDTYTPDRRFRGLHLPNSPEWTLQIKGKAPPLVSHFETKETNESSCLSPIGNKNFVEEALSSILGRLNDIHHDYYHYYCYWDFLVEL